MQSFERRKCLRQRIFWVDNMTEPKRLPFTTVTDSEKEKKSKKDPPTVRFSLSLNTPNEQQCSEFSYADLLKKSLVSWQKLKYCVNFIKVSFFFIIKQKLSQFRVYFTLFGVGNPHHSLCISSVLYEPWTFSTCKNCLHVDVRCTLHSIQLNKIARPKCTPSCNICSYLLHYFCFLVKNWTCRFLSSIHLIGGITFEKKVFSKKIYFFVMLKMIVRNNEINGD